LRNAGEFYLLYKIACLLLKYVWQLTNNHPSVLQKLRNRIEEKSKCTGSDWQTRLAKRADFGPDAEAAAQGPAEATEPPGPGRVALLQPRGSPPGHPVATVLQHPGGGERRARLCGVTPLQLARPTIQVSAGQLRKQWTVRSYTTPRLGFTRPQTTRRFTSSSLTDVSHAHFCRVLVEYLTIHRKHCCFKRFYMKRMHFVLFENVFHFSALTTLEKHNCFPKPMTQAVVNKTSVVNALPVAPS